MSDIGENMKRYIIILMAVRKIPFVKDEYYHIYNRGNSKQNIFFDDEDYNKFIKYLYVCNTQKNINFRDDIVDNNIDAYDFDRGKSLVSIGAWVLMPNHFHIYLTISPMSDIGESNAITEFMRKLSTSYVKYLNEKYNRTGGLFEGPFKAKHIKTNEQAKYLFSYIHLNPVKLIDSKWKENGIKNKKKTLSFLKNYRWSSYLDHKGVRRPENKIIDVKDFLIDFQNSKDFDKEITDWLEYEKSD
jgi:putative transposase